MRKMAEKIMLLVSVCMMCGYPSFAAASEVDIVNSFYDKIPMEFTPLDTNGPVVILRRNLSNPGGTTLDAYLESLGGEGGTANSVEPLYYTGKITWTTQTSGNSFKFTQFLFNPYNVCPAGATTWYMFNVKNGTFGATTRTFHCYDWESTL